MSQVPELSLGLMCLFLDLRLGLVKTRLQNSTLLEWRQASDLNLQRAAKERVAAGAPPPAGV